MMGIQFKNITTRLVFLFFTVAIIPILCISVIVYQQRARAVKQREFTKLTAIRDLKVEQVSDWLHERAGDVQAVSESPNIRKAGDVLKRESAYDPNVLTAARQSLERYCRHYTSYRNLCYIDAASGITKLSTRTDEEGQDYSNKAFFSGPVASMDAYIGEIHYSQALKQMTMAFSAPVYSYTNKDQIVGVLVAWINLNESLYELLSKRTGLGKTGETLIVNKNGIALNELRWRKNAPLNLKISAEPSMKASSGEQGIAEALDYRNIRVLAAYTSIPKVGWGFVAKQDFSEIYEPIAVMLKQLSLIVLMLTVGVYFAALITARAIAGPILAMTRMAEKITAGDLSARNTIERPDEFGFLGKVFNEMTASLVSRLKIQGCVQDVIEIMITCADMDDFSRTVLDKIIEITESDFGVFYVLDDSQNVFAPAYSVGVAVGPLDFVNADHPDGQIGAALKLKKIRRVTEISEDTVFAFKTIAGAAVPKEIIAIPILVDGESKAGISVGRMSPYSKESIEIMELIPPGLNTGFSNLTANVRTAKMAEDLQVKNEELSVVNEELHSQTEELREQADEMKIQAERLEDQKRIVKEADRLKSEFLSNMSHELRTPLNSVLVLSRLMIGRGVGKKPEEDAEYLTVIERNGRRLLNLINDILDLSKIESGRMEVSLSRFDIHDALDVVMETIAPLANAKGLKFHTQIGDITEIESDMDKLQQILLNLLSNAVKFTPGGAVDLKVDTSGDQIIFQVKDTGIGIPESDLSSIFDAFRQIDGSTTRTFEGAGLGLCISKKFAGMLGGEIRAESKPGRGSTFTLCLPMNVPGDAVRNVAAQADAYFYPPPGAPMDEGEKQKADVLLIEDNDIATIQVKTVLEENGFDVVTASDGNIGLQCIRQRTPDAVILDLMMPGIDGFQVLDKIRSDPNAADIPVLILTAKELSAEERARLKKQHVGRLIQKGGMNRDQILDAVKQLIRFSKPAPVSEPQQPKSDSTRRGAKKMILVAEDNPDNLFTISTILRDADYDLVTAGNGVEAIRKAKQHRPDLILMDIQLPVMNGMDAAAKLKSDPDCAQIPVVALTARAMKGEREKILASGCDDYMAKPFDPDTLLAGISQWTKDGR